MNDSNVFSWNTTFVTNLCYNTEAELTGLLDDDYVDVDESPSAADIGGSFSGGLTIDSSAVQDAEMDYTQVTLADFTNDPEFTSNNTDVNYTSIRIADSNGNYRWYVDSTGALILTRE